MSRPQSHIFAVLDRDEPDPVLVRPARRCCPVPRCTQPVPTGKYAIFCAECHFRLPYETTNSLFRWQLKCEREQDDAIRQGMLAELPAKIRQAVREITDKPVVH